MASAIHGATLDIHGGGVDLKFPHHDNEIAQTEAHFGSDQWVNYFLHAGHLHIKGLKMAKSLKNFVTIREALEKFTPTQIRIMFLLQQWDRPVNFSDQTLSEARDKEARIQSFFARVDQVGRNFPIATSAQKWDAADHRLADSVLANQERVHAALCDNFDTPSAMEAIEACIAAANQYLLEQPVPKHPLLLRAKDFVTSILAVFGVIDEQAAGASAQTDALVAGLVHTRDRVREIAAATKNPDLLALSDELRDELFVALGIKVVDGAKSADAWSLVNPDELRRELETRRAEKQAKEVAKLENKRAILAKEIAKWERHASSKSEQEALFPGISEFDAEGLPVDPEMSASKRKNLKKELEKFRKERTEYEAKGGLAYVEKLTTEHDTLSQQIAAANSA
jgi:cysteinyl-tRNA synthetase